MIPFFFFTVLPRDVGTSVILGGCGGGEKKRVDDRRPLGRCDLLDEEVLDELDVEVGMTTTILLCHLVFLSLDATISHKFIFSRVIESPR